MAGRAGLSGAPPRRSVALAAVCEGMTCDEYVTCDKYVTSSACLARPLAIFNFLLMQLLRLLLLPLPPLLRECSQRLLALHHCPSAAPSRSRKLAAICSGQKFVGGSSTRQAATHSLGANLRAQNCDIRLSAALTAQGDVQVYARSLCSRRGFLLHSTDEGEADMPSFSFLSHERPRNSV